LEKRTALRLQSSAAMRFHARVLIAAVGVLVAPIVARAQTGTSSTSTTMAVGSCTGGVTATIGFAARTATQSASNQPTPISQTFAPTAFGKAECDCDPSEASGEGIYMLLQVSMGFSQGTQANALAYVGTGCDDYQTRINQAAVSCANFQPMNLNSNSFTAGNGNIGVSTFYYLWVPARLLFSPSTGLCTENGANSIWIFLGNNQQMPDATCEVDISEQATPPSAAVTPVAGSGDSAITLTWQAPTLTNTTNLISPSYYQVLCANEDGSVLDASKTPAQPAYSTCLPSGIQRRQNIFNPTNISGGSADGGVTDGGIVEDLLGFSGHVPSPDPASPAVVDAGTQDLSLADLSVIPDLSGINPSDTTIRPTNLEGLGVFSTLDPKYICSSYIDATTTTSFSKRITGLTNNSTYQFLVLAIDQYGNAAPSPLLTGVPKPVEDLYGALRADGLDAHGFCFVATAAFGDYDHPMVRILRAFRDRVLETSTLGRLFVRGYYASSPPLANFIAAGNGRRFVARVLLWPLVGIAEIALFLHSLLLTLFLLAGVPATFFVVRRRRRRAQIEATA
jgi:hypothetical protein